MFQKNQLQKLDNKYNSHAYTGLMGIFMKYCHKQLEKIEFPENISKVLEIGAGSAPHINYVKHNFDEYHIIETSDFAINRSFIMYHLTLKSAISIDSSFNLSESISLFRFFSSSTNFSKYLLTIESGALNFVFETK